MTTAAWVTMLLTWIVIAFFAIRFFWMVYRNPGGGDGD